MKRTQSILNDLQTTIDKLHDEIVNVLLQVIRTNNNYIINNVIIQLLNSFIILIEQELIEFKTIFNEQLDLNIDYEYTKNLKIFMNSCYEYNYDFYLTDYKDSYKTIINILNGTTDIYYLESNLYTLIASYLRMLILYKLLYNLTESNFETYKTVFYYSKYKTYIAKHIETLKSE